MVVRFKSIMSNIFRQREITISTIEGARSVTKGTSTMAQYANKRRSYLGKTKLNETKWKKRFFF